MPGNNRIKHMSSIEYRNFFCEVSISTDTVGLGITIGSSSFIGDKRDNVFINIDILILSIVVGIEFRSK